MQKERKSMTLRIGVFIFLVISVMLTGCVHTRLSHYEFHGESLHIDAYVPAYAEISTDHYVTFDGNDPIGTIMSIGSSVAKSASAWEAQKRLDSVMRQIDLQEIMEEELEGHFSEHMGMQIVNTPQQASYRLVVEVSQYGISAPSGSGGTFFTISGKSHLYDIYTGRRVWRKSFTSRQRMGPEVFGLPSAADNILIAVILSDLSEEEMAQGIDQISRKAARDIGRKFERDLYRARRKH